MTQRTRAGLQQQLVLAVILALLIPIVAIAAYTNLLAREAIVDKAGDAFRRLADEYARAVEQPMTGAASELQVAARGPSLRRYAAAPPLLELLADGHPQVSTPIFGGPGAYLSQPVGAIVDSRDRPGELQLFRHIQPQGQSALRSAALYAQPFDVLLAITTQSWVQTALLLLAALLAALLATRLLARAIARPLRELSLVAARLGSGDLHPRIPRHAPDEVAALGSTYDQTVTRLREAIELAEARRHEAETLRAAARALGSTLSLDEVLGLILSELRKVVPYDSASVQVIEGDAAVIIGEYGLVRGASMIGSRFSLVDSASPNAEVVRARAPVLLADAPSRYPIFKSEPYRADPIQSWLGVPLLFGERLIGMVTLDKHDPNFYTGNHARLASDFAAHAAIAIEHARLFAGAQQELAERRRAEAAHARLAAVIEATSDFVAMCDPRGRMIYVNRAGRALMGMSEGEDVTRTHVQNYVVPSAVAGLHAAAGAAVAAGSWVGETTLCSWDGSEIPASQVIIAHYGPDGAVEYFSTIVRDMREPRRAEEELRQAQKMEALGRLAGGLAHDFNNLLTVILGECEMMLGDMAPDDPNLPAVEQIRQSGSRAAALTRQLLAFSRRQVLQPELIDLNEVIRGMEQLLRRLIGEDVTLTIALADDLPTVRADRGQIEQVVMNLAINARDAMPHGGRLLIETGAAAIDAEAARQHVDAAPGRYAVIAVSDTGLGMDEVTRAHVFEPFFTTKPRGKGTGLGLATVHGIVRQSGGQIWFASEQGRGSTFTVYLPAVSGGQPPQPLAPRCAQARSAAETVLLVEDDEHVRSLARAILLRYGFVVLEAGEGNAAIELARSHPGEIHVLLSDVVMPGGLNGVQTAAAVRALRPQIRVLYMSGYTDDALAGRELMDNTRYIQKPFTPDDLVGALMETLTV